MNFKLDVCILVKLLKSVRRSKTSVNIRNNQVENEYTI